MNSEAVSSSVPGRVTTGVPGLDEVLHGGLPEGNVYLIEGDPGAGKTTLAVQYLLAGAANNEKALLVALSENRSELDAIAAGHGWDLSAIEIIELVPSESHLNPEEAYTFFHPEEMELAGTIKTILQAIEQSQATRVVIDSLAELRLLAQDARHYRRQVLALKQHFARRSGSVLLLDDRTSSGGERQLHSVVHGVISLERLPRQYGRNRRRMEVSKMRGSAFVEGFHDYLIEQGGVRVFPRLVASDHAIPFERGSISTGVPELDSLLGGGLARGSSTLLVGPAGCGKSTISVKYGEAAANRGEHVALYSFEESRDSLMDRAKAIGIHLFDHMDNGTVTVEQIDPAELSPGEFAAKVRASVETRGTRVVIIDSLNGYLAAMPEEQFLTLQMHELLSFLNQRGIITILVLAQQGVLQLQTTVDLSYLADTIVLLRFFEAQGRVRKAVSVVKKRTSAHEQMIRELMIGPPLGIRVGDPLSDFHGVLTGVPEYIGEGPLALNSSDENS